MHCLAVVVVGWRQHPQVHEQQGKAVVAMTLDVVHEPKLVSEFEQHEKQTLDLKAHYHFYPPEGVELSAAKVLAQLQSNGVIKGEKMRAGTRPPGWY